MGSPSAPVFAVVLASGSSRRFGGNKLLAPLAGRPVLERVIRAVQACERQGILRASYVVAPAPDSAVALLARSLGARVVVSPRSSEGMGWSLRAGLEAVRASAPTGPAALLVVLGDQPGVQPDVVSALVRRWRATGAPTVRPRYADEPDAPGHPVLVDRTQWERIAALEGDRGLGIPPDAGEIVEVAGDNPDIDTRADLEALSRKEPT